MEVADLFGMSLVFLAVPKEGCYRRFKPCRNDLLFKKSQKCFFCYHLQCSFKIFITLFNFLHVKANPKESGEEMLFPYFFPKNADATIFVEIQG